MTKKKPESEEVEAVPRGQSRWMRMLDEALAEAESNPQQFIANAKKKGGQAIATAREVRRLLKEDPTKPLESAGHGIVQGLARRLRREIFGGE